MSLYNILSCPNSSYELSSIIWFETSFCILIFVYWRVPETVTVGVRVCLIIRVWHLSNIYTKDRILFLFLFPPIKWGSTFTFSDVCRWLHLSVIYTGYFLLYYSVFTKPYKMDFITYETWKLELHVS